MSYVQYKNLFFIKLKIALKKMLEYKTNFFAIIFHQVIYIFLFVLSFLVIYQFTPDIAGFKLHEILIYFFFFDLSTSFFWFFRVDLINNIMSDDFIVALSKPINPLIVLGDTPTDYILFASLDFLAIVFCFIYFGLQVNLINLILGTIFFFVSLFLPWFELHTLESFTFWFGRVYSFRIIFNSLTYRFETYPIKVLPKNILIFFVFLAPNVYFTLYLPVAIFLNKISIINIIYNFVFMLFFIIVLYILFIYTFKKGLRSYEGFGG